MDIGVGRLGLATAVLPSEKYDDDVVEIRERVASGQWTSNLEHVEPLAAL